MASQGIGIYHKCCSTPHPPSPSGTKWQYDISIGCQVWSMVTYNPSSCTRSLMTATEFFASLSSTAIKDKCHWRFSPSLTPPLTYVGDESAQCPGGRTYPWQSRCPKTNMWQLKQHTTGTQYKPIPPQPTTYLKACDRRPDFETPLAILALQKAIICYCRTITFCIEF